jgi:hypothetical protein
MISFSQPSLLRNFGSQQRRPSLKKAIVSLHHAKALRACQILGKILMGKLNEIDDFWD